MNYKVKRQTDVSSKNWGVYLNDKLIEGGFFCKEAAEKVADEYDEYTKDSKTKDGRYYNMAVIYELTNYYRLPSNKAQSLVEKYSQELQKKENNKTTPETAAKMILATEQ